MGKLDSNREMEMTRYYDTATRTETDIPSATTIHYTDARVEKFFKPMQYGEKIIFDEDGLPYFYTEDLIKPTIVDGKVVEGESEAERLLRIQSSRLSRLEQIFSTKTVGLKKLAIDKPWMNDVEAINNQYRVYEEMYKNAKNGLYDAATNDAIIAANENAKSTLAPLTLLLNTIRGVIEAAIYANDVNSDAMLDAADAITLTKEELTPAKIDEIKAVFGL